MSYKATITELRQREAALRAEADQVGAAAGALEQLENGGGSVKRREAKKVLPPRAGGSGTTAGPARKGKVSRLLVPQSTIDGALRRLKAGEKVTAIAKELKVSAGAVYGWKYRAEGKR